LFKFTRSTKKNIFTNREIKIMKKVIAFMVCVLFGVTLVLAQEAAAPAAAPADVKAPAAPAAGAEVKAPTIQPIEVHKTGIVNVTKDASGKVTSIKLIYSFYEVQLDDEGKKLEAMDGQKVKVSCYLTHEGGKKIITVKSFEAAADTSAAPATKAPAAGAAPAAAPAGAPATTPAAAPAPEVK
jgi:hypothetical protein